MGLDGSREVSIPCCSNGMETDNWPMQQKYHLPGDVRCVSITCCILVLAMLNGKSHSWEEVERGSEETRWVA